ncbi:MAG: hypothetical protein DHS20C18_05340 [Saprospiraceae bacterium]|nr:MAG: hypothetical protein DHS20C18_05340 [Saprospiraceae bacterium]
MSFLISLGLTACVNDPADIEALNDLMQTNIERAENVQILYSDSAKLKVQIQGPVMLNHLDKAEPKQEFTDGVKVVFFDPNGKISSTLTAKYAVRFERKNQVIVQDSVVWKSEKNEQLDTEELIWDEQQQRVYTQKFVVITRPDEIIYGHGFEANQDFTNAKINAVEGQIAVDPLEEKPVKKPESSPTNKPQN